MNNINYNKKTEREGVLEGLRRVGICLGRWGRRGEPIMIAASSEAGK